MPGFQPIRTSRSGETGRSRRLRRLADHGEDGLGAAAALRGAGVPVEYREYPGMIHAFFGMAPAVDDAMNAQRTVWAAFKRAFA